jgi:uridine kinase/ribulose-5-phosphate 4-epimerase/fuculose-1-phosphate aldolase
MYKVISIAGSSGVGKTTLAKLLLINYEKYIHLTGDNYHKWERGNHNWNKYTHLDPQANELEKAFLDLSSLKDGHTISVSQYSHDTGKFCTPKKVKSEGVIIHEGLHSLYTEELRKVSDLKIFVDTDEDLKLEWKIERDMKERGYTRSQVLEAIHSRQADEVKYIDPQRQHADIVVKFVKKNSKVDLEYVLVTGNGGHLMEQLLSLYKVHQDYVSVCNDIGKDGELVKHRGGNISYKHMDKIVVTSSGSKLQEVKLFKNLSVCRGAETVMGSRPSMELPFHLKLEKNVIHTHPYYLNILLCSREGVQILDSLFKEFNYNYLPYECPGKNLESAVENCDKKPIIFLENHGLITNSTTMSGTKSLTVAVSQVCKDWFLSQEKKSVQNPPKGYLYPDAVIYDTEASGNESMIKDIMSVGLTPKFLSHLEVQELQLSEEEQYRMAVQ